MYDSTRKTTANRQLPDLRPIRGDRELEQATQVSFSLSQAAETRRLTRDESDYLEVLIMLIEKYEEARYPIRKLPTPRARLQALVDASGMRASDLGRLLGNRALGNKLLRGERELSKAHIRRLAEHFKVEPGFFL